MLTFDQCALLTSCNHSRKTKSQPYLVSSHLYDGGTIGWWDLELSVVLDLETAGRNVPEVGLRYEPHQKATNYRTISSPRLVLGLEMTDERWDRAQIAYSTSRREVKVRLAPARRR